MAPARKLYRFERNLLQEYRALRTIHETWNTCAVVTEETLKAYGDTLDPHLKSCIEAVIDQLVGLLLQGADLDIGKKKPVVVESIVKALQEVQDEVKATQAGRRTREPKMEPPQNPGSGPETTRRKCRRR